jgi:hypothetical protein
VTFLTVAPYVENQSKKEEKTMIKIVVFTDGKDACCMDEKWRRFQYVLPNVAYKGLKKTILKLERKYDP